MAGKVGVDEQIGDRARNVGFDGGGLEDRGGRVP
jgi:hypothetical protein